MAMLDSSVQADPLELNEAPERVNYATGMLLGAEDFRDEQTYHRGRLAAALRHLVGFGTLAGLAVRTPVPEDNELELRVEPGIAVDRYGRLIELDAPYCIRLARWFAAQDAQRLRASVHRKPRTPLDVAVVVDVFLSALQCGRGKTPSFASGPIDALDAVVPARLAEAPELTLVPRLEGGPAPIPAPENNWPAPNANSQTKLKAVLGSWNLGLGDGPDSGAEPLAEYVDGMNMSAVLLARIAIPVTLAEDAPAEVGPVLDLTKRVLTDNGLRPFIYLPGKWLGRPAADVPISEP